jgi:hypothetical protein
MFKCPICKHNKLDHEFRSAEHPELRWICWACPTYLIVSNKEAKSKGFLYSSYHKFPDNLEMVEILAKERKLL